jgi:hypothetical protein
MEILKMLDVYLTPDKKHFKRRENIAIPLDEFYKVLGVYTKINSDNKLELANYLGGKSHMNWLLIKNGAKFYKVNGDTKLAGLKEFYNNRNNPCKTIYNRDGRKNLISNDLNGNNIEHLYIYKSE